MSGTPPDERLAMLAGVARCSKEMSKGVLLHQ